MKSSRRAWAASLALLVMVLGGFVTGSEFARQEGAWEYHLEYGHPTAETLNKAGAEGWELVSVVHTPRSYVATTEREYNSFRTDLGIADATTVAIFKRRPR